MLIANVADSHWDDSPGGRIDECDEVHDWIAQDMDDKGVDVLLHGGDVCERASTPEVRRRYTRWFQRATEKRPAVVVRGNHDRWKDLLILQTLRTQHPIHVVEDAQVIDVDGLVVGCLAWPRRAGVLKLAAERGWGHEGAEAIAGEALRAVLRGLGQEMAELAKAPGTVGKVLLAHAMVRNSKTSLGQPLVGCDMEVGLDDLRLAGADFYSLGHIHMPQSWAGDFVYPGSPRRTAYGETEDKGYVIYDTDSGSWHRVQTPCAQMLLLEDAWAPLDFLKLDGPAPYGWTGNPLSTPAVARAGADIRFRYTVPADRQKEAAAAAAAFGKELLAAGVRHFKPEPIVQSVKVAKVPAVAAARTVGAKLEALWDSRDDGPDEERRARLLGKLAELEGETDAIS